MRPSTLLGLLLAAASPVLHAVSTITTQDILQPDPAERARKSFDDGLPSLIDPLDCDASFQYEPIELAWVGSDLIYPEDNCEDLAASDTYKANIEDIQRAINDYNIAIVERAQETGAFPVYALYSSHAQPTEQHREQAQQLLRSISAGLELEALELSVFTGHANLPIRMIIAGEIEDSDLAQDLAARDWKQAPWPGPMLQAMHWYPGPGDQYLAGDIDGYRATALLSESSGLIVLAIALNLRVE
jgi:hypothetical protein